MSALSALSPLDAGVDLGWSVWRARLATRRALLGLVGAAVTAGVLTSWTGRRVPSVTR